MRAEMRTVYVVLFMLVSIAVFSAAAPTPSGDPAGPGFTGNDFLQKCDKGQSEGVDLLYCYGYISGLNDAFMYGKILWSGKPPFCNQDTTTDQNVRIVLKYIKDNPEQAHTSTGLLFLQAMQKAFPCAAEKRK